MKKDKKLRFYWEKPYAKKDTNIKIDVPGYKKDKIKVHISKGMLNITAEKKAHIKEKGKGFYHEESSFSSFSNSISLPEGIEEKDIAVEIKDGKILLKKKKKAIK